MGSQNWWATKLGADSSQPITPVPQNSYPPVANPAYMTPMTPAPAANTFQSSATPPSSQSDTTCPSCRKNNYMTIGSMLNQTTGQMVEAKRCFNCGYPKVQSGTGLSGVGGSTAGPATPAKQVPTGGWNPGVFINNM